ncbi:hypothetical protein GOP47_0014867 [Adiantum capillus-veneris]|uniref:C2H2-type domain-containing protein n=1 Tax=Adiantum capillus-veneris TaxID=13818 RepID=A0A9D4ZCV9_ADICA|nr:hypothetical protein GOP47_0014867 [Adiantum capillus-veneris]
MDSSNSTGSNAEDFPPFASEWKKPPSGRRASWRSFQHTNSKHHSFPVVDDSTKPAAPPFCFQRRCARIDWRTLHALDVDQIIREIDVNKLESVLDTIAFGDVQGEDTRNFTEANFVKLFRLSQLMVEYLLHTQEVLVSQKSQLLEAGATLYKRAEKFRLRCVWQHEALWQSHRDLKRSKKTIRTYEALLRSQGQALPVASVTPPLKQAHYCPFCDKVFESASYLDMHISRRHSASKEPSAEARASLGQTKLNSSSAPLVKEMATSALQTEGDNWRDIESSNATQVASLQMALKESNNKLRNVQQQLDNLQRNMQNSKPSRKDFGDKYEERKAAAAQEKLRELEVKFVDFEHQIKQLGQENAKLLKELNAAYSEVSGLKSEKRRFILSMDQHDEQDYARALLERKPKAIKDWLHAAETSPLRPQGPKKQDASALESLQDPISRRNTSVTIDALTDAEEEISPDKQKWLSLHSYAPIPNLPFALAKYPHSPALFISKRNEISRRLEKLLREELLKFGIPPNAEGISDAKYAVVAAALEKQRAFRLSSAAPSEKRVMEYERSTILWHIERAVHSRDMSILESIFDEETESASGNDANGEEPYSEDDELFQSPTSAEQSHRFEGNLSGRRSLSHQGSEHSGRSREQFSDVLAISRNPASPNSIDDLEPHTFQVVGQLTTQRVPSISDEQPPQCNIILSAVSSPTTLVPDHRFENFEENTGLGDWESDGEGDSSFAQSSPRKIGKDDHHDAASASSKNTARLSDLDRRT